MCRHCNTSKVFFNRCNLLCHIRSHAFKTATINVSDLKVEPLPMSFFKPVPALTDSISSKDKATRRKDSIAVIMCFECKATITNTGIPFKDRATHFMKFSNEVISCPVCLFALPNLCAFKIHMRIHVQRPPYYCPECGIHLADKNVQYPYNHDCEGFKMMRATARMNCTVPNCNLFHPNDYEEHMKRYHLKKVYKCPFCVVACFNELTMDKHLKTHKTAVKALLFYQCDICPGRYVLQNPKLNDGHLKSHVKGTIYPCWACAVTFTEVLNLLHHFLRKHNRNEMVAKAVRAILHKPKENPCKANSVYRVVKRCEQCKRNFTYKCRFEEIPILPVECPFNCSSDVMVSRLTPENTQDNNEDLITCHLCRDKISQDWEQIKKHYKETHKTHKCLDAKILLTRIDITKYLTQKKTTKQNTTLQKVTKRARNKKLYKYANATASGKQSSKPCRKIKVHACKMCEYNFMRKSELESHMKVHRDPCMAYQCLECGQSFVVKPSFSKHLLLEHGITDADDYIKNKQCYNEDALLKHQNTVEIELPLEANQCKICRDKFDSPEDLEKHFRVHGMAFLLKNTSTKNNAS